MAYQPVRGTSVSGKRALTAPQRDECAARYAAGERARDLAREYGIAEFGVARLAEVRGFNRHGRYLINHHCFDDDTPAAFYWAGFLMADGCVRANRNRISLKLAIKDIRHLEKFRAFVGSTAPIHTVNAPAGFILGQPLRPTAAAEFSFTSATIAAVLAKRGVIPNKTIVGIASAEASKNKHFWRGMIDGDGSVYVSRRQNDVTYPSLMLCGGYDLLYQFSLFCQERAPSIRRAISPTRGRHFIYSLVGGPAYIIISLLYGDLEVSLERKQTTANSLIRNHTSRALYRDQLRLDLFLDEAKIAVP